jgi:IS5 family transposase
MVAMPPGKRRLLAPGSAEAVAERAKASVRAKVEHPFRVIKQQFGHMKARYRGLAKNGSHLVTLFALSNLWMARRTLLAG